MAQTDPITAGVLLQLCRLRLRARARASIEGRARDVDWQAIARLALRGGVAGLVASHLVDLPAVPRSIVRTLTQHSLASELANRRLIDAATRLCDRAERAGLTLIPLKGAALNLGRPYADPGLRAQCDIDLLARRAEFAAVERLLRDCGYQPSSASSYLRRHKHHVTFFSQAGGRISPSGGIQQRTMLELHWTPFFCLFGDERLDDAAIGRAAVCDHQGRSIRLLDPTDMLLSVALHLAEHRFRAQLKWLVDLAELARFHLDTIHYNALWHRAGRLDARRAVSRALQLARALLAAPVPVPPLRAGSLAALGLPALRALTGDENLVRSAGQPGWARSFAIDLLATDHPSTGARNALHKLAELAERRWGPLLPGALLRARRLRSPSE